MGGSIRVQRYPPDCVQPGSVRPATYKVAGCVVKRVICVSYTVRVRVKDRVVNDGYNIIPLWRPGPILLHDDSVQSSTAPRPSFSPISFAMS